MKILEMRLDIRRYISNYNIEPPLLFNRFGVGMLK